MDQQERELVWSYLAKSQDMASVAGEVDRSESAGRDFTPQLPRKLEIPTYLQL
jgi:hypothetical protein